MSTDVEGHDPAHVVELRRASLARAGYDPVSADELARRVDISLRDALQLVKGGFPPDVALKMLTSGERPVF